jgi:hypothetical protein
MEEREVKEFEWYLRDYLFRQYNLNNRRIMSRQLPIEMINTYLRYRHSDQIELTRYLEDVLENLLARHVITEITIDGFFELHDNLSRLQCAKCYYVSYLNHLEPRECLRCASTDLNEFPRRNK